MRRFWATILCGAMLGVVTTQAAVIVSNTWDDAGDGLQEWAIDPGHGSLSRESWGGDGFLRIDGPADPQPTHADFVYSSGVDSGLIGDWSAMGADPGKEVRSIRFDFYADAGGAVDHPTALRLYFQGGTDLWYYSLDVESLSSGWNFLYANINAESPSNLYGGTWWTEGAGLNWAADFGSVSEVGLWLAYQSGAGYESQIYGIDNFELHDQIYIPEPGTWLMLGFAFLSMAVTFRKRLEGLAAQAWARVRA